MKCEPTRVSPQNKPYQQRYQQDVIPPRMLTFNEPRLTELLLRYTTIDI